MKRLAWCILLMVGCCISAPARQPAPVDSSFVEAAAQPDSLSSDERQFIDLLARDTVWQEAVEKEGFDFRVLGRYARDDAYYGRLTERFERADTTLFGSDFLVLYYGYAYRDEYDGGYGTGPWKQSIREEKYDEAYAMIVGALKKAPATPHLLSEALQLALATNRPEEEIRSLQWRLGALLGWMSMLGNGTRELPIPVVNVIDEYTYMYDMLGIARLKGQELVKNDHNVMCDRMEVVPAENAYFTGSEIWFDITFPITALESPRHWAKKLAKKEK